MNRHGVRRSMRRQVFVERLSAGDIRERRLRGSSRCLCEGRRSVAGRSGVGLVLGRRARRHLALGPTMGAAVFVERGVAFEVDGEHQEAVPDPLLDAAIIEVDDLGLV